MAIVPDTPKIKPAKFLSTCKTHFRNNIPSEMKLSLRDWTNKNIRPLDPQDRLELAQYFEEEGYTILDIDDLKLKAEAFAIEKAAASD
jgi:hypothetical protein